LSLIFFLPLETRQSKEVSSHLEASLSAKEKIISELCFELNTIENALLSEHEQHLLESKRLNSLINEKVMCLVPNLFAEQG
jgi:hypothetical protein